MYYRYLIFSLLLLLMVGCEKPDHRPAGTAEEVPVAETEKPFTDFVADLVSGEEEGDAADHGFGISATPDEGFDDTVPGTPVVPFDPSELPEGETDGN